MLVVLEGADGVGKTTLINDLINQYPNIYKAFPVTFPTYKKETINSLTPHYIRDNLYNYLINGKQSQISDLYFQLANLIDKVMHVDLINDCKNDNKYIYLLDRYKPSGFVYGTLSLIESGLDKKTAIYICSEINKLIIDADFEIFLHLDVDRIVNRIEIRNEQKSIYENKDFLINVINNYQEYFLKYIVNGIIIDANLSKNDLIQSVHQHIIGVFKNDFGEK